jgi:hypothetical protein
MKYFLKFTLIISLLPFVAIANKSNFLADTIIITSHQLFNNKIDIKKSIYHRSSLNFLVLHDDENTGVEAALQYCENNGGSITELVYGNKRFITFGEKSKYSFDPNQIFNKDGIARTLKKYSRTPYATSHVEDISKLSENILERYKPDSLGYIITLHNNTENNFDINSYQPNGYLFGTADSIYVNEQMDADDFIFVTEPEFFSYLKEQQINVVYQSPNGPIDGSLSVYAQQNKIPYINIEVQHGHVDENLRLIYVVDNMFKQLVNEVREVSKIEKQN